MSIIDLWLPILAASVLVFIASAIVWTVMPWHNSDFKPSNDEDAARSAFSGHAPGVYMLPYCTDPRELEKEDIQAAFQDGPVAYVTVQKSGIPAMGPRLVKSFLFYTFVSALCAYMVSRLAAPDASYLESFRIAGTVAWAAYGVGFVHDSIWFAKPWSITLKNMFDALIYALVTAGAFGWLA